MVNMGRFIHILAPTQHAAFSRCPALLMLGLRAGAGDSQEQGLERCKRDEYRILHPSEARRHLYEAGYIWASAADGFRRWRFVGMRVRTRCPADYADFAWIGVRIGAFSSESRNPPRLNRRRGSHFRALG